MDIEKLEKLNNLKEKGVLTKEEFEIEKEKILNKSANINPPSNTKESLEIRATDVMRNYGIKIFMIVSIIFFVGYMAINQAQMDVADYIILFIIASVFGTLLKEYQKMSKEIKDLHHYKSINDILSKYGTPDDVKKYEDYVKYVFKKSTNGWGKCKYRVDIFTLKNDMLIKHESFYE